MSKPSGKWWEHLEIELFRSKFVIEKFQSSFRAVSEQFQSSFEPI